MDDICKKVVAAAQSELELCVYSWSRVLANRCESPIEVLFVRAFVFHYLLEFSRLPHLGEGFGGKIEDEWYLEPQVQIDNYRVDFLLHCPEIKHKIVVECDGHDFHERTKEQAARDRSRDRFLTQKGYVVLRFTGSEIWADPWDCVNQLSSQVFSIMYREADVP